MRPGRTIGRGKGFARSGFLVLLVAVLAGLSLSPAEFRVQRGPVEVYLAEDHRAPHVRRQFRQQFQRSFLHISEEQYATFMEGLDLDRDEDLFRWSQVTGIHIVALRKTSYFFRMNLHLMEDIDAASQLNRREAYRYKTFYDKEAGKIDLRDESGNSLRLRPLPGDLFVQSERAGPLWHFRGFVDGEINYEAIGPYLIHFSKLPYRHALGDWIRMIPLNIVKAYGGKAIYLTNLPGRSFATTMPVSNTVYKLHAGLVTGVWIEMRHDSIEGTRSNFIHEFGHVFDYVVIQGGYGSFRDSLQFPEFRDLQEEKEEVFGVDDDKVPDTPFGYISNYARTNAQENFAEHFRAFITENEQFRKRADREAAQGHPELHLKYEFMEKLMTGTPATRVHLSTAVLEEEAKKIRLSK